MPVGARREWLRARLHARFDKPVVCPAGVRYDDALKGPSCFCRIEESEITCAEQPTTLFRYCQGDYTECSTWRSDKEAAWERRATLADLPGRPRQTVLDEDPDTRPEFLLPEHPGA